MTLQQLRYLIAIANHGSISAAAHTLYVSQSSLSVAVRDIERETGVTIFERSNRGITLTSDGIELLGYARQVVEQADLMEQRYSGRGGEAAQESLHHLPALRVRGGGVPGTGRGVRGRRLQLQPARDPHLRGHRGRARLPQRSGRAVPLHVQRERHRARPFRREPLLQPAVHRAAPRIRQRQAPLGLAHRGDRGRSGGLPPLRLRAGGKQLVLLFRGAPGRAAPHRSASP